MMFSKIRRQCKKWWRIDARIFTLSYKRMQAQGIIDECGKRLSTADDINYLILAEIAAKYHRRIVRIDAFMRKK